MSDPNREVKTVKDIGEKELLKIIKSYVSIPEGSALGFGDDAVALGFKSQNLLVFNTDMLVCKTDCPPGITPYQIGAKTVTMNVSDLAAKGVQPYGMLSSIGLPNDYPIENVKNIFKGIKEKTSSYGLHYLGGDIGESSDLIISGVVFGKSKKVIPRNGAKVGDLVISTGFFGLTGAGLHMLINKIPVSSKAIEEELKKAVFEPNARLKEGLVFNEKSVTASIDSSDGLANCLYEISKQSDVKIIIDNPPIHDSVIKYSEENNLDPFDFVFYTGEEYELIATISKKDLDSLLDEIPSINIIGKVENGNGVFLDTGKTLKLIQDKGWDHFQNST